MQNCGIKVKYKSIINQIKKELAPASYVECGNCGAIKSDAKELARAISDIDYNEIDAEEVYMEIQNSITENGPNFTDEVDWNEWDRENKQRLCSFLEVVDSDIYILYSEVILYVDETCTCFKDKLAS